MKNRLTKRIRNMESQFKSKEKQNIFLKISFALSFIIAMLLLFRTSIELAILGALTIGFFPYLLFKLKERNDMIHVSMEGNILVSEILNNYRVCACNVSDAIVSTVYSLDGAPHSKKVLLPLAIAMDGSASYGEVKQALDNFDKDINTFWSKALSNNLYYGYIFGIDITTALEDLLQSTVKSKQITEYNIRSNNEGKVILKWIVPVCCVLTVVGACTSFGFTVSKFIKYQFLTPVGISWFLIFVISYVISILTYFVLAKRKMDI